MSFYLNCSREIKKITDFGTYGVRDISLIRDRLMRINVAVKFCPKEKKFLLISGSPSFDKEALNSVLSNRFGLCAWTPILNDDRGGLYRLN